MQLANIFSLITGDVKGLERASLRCKPAAVSRLSFEYFMACFMLTPLAHRMGPASSLASTLAQLDRGMPMLPGRTEAKDVGR